MTYDDAEEVRSLAQRYGFDSHLVAMHARMTERLIGRCLDWARRLMNIGASVIARCASG